MMKRTAAILVCFIFSAVLLTGCTIHVNESRNDPPLEEILANDVLLSDPVKFDPEGAYQITFHLDKGGFAKMDLSRAYVAYYPFTVLDQIEAITSDDGSDEFPPLPDDAQSAVNAALGTDELQKIAVITIETTDDKTVKVSFTDKDDPLPGREYFFIIPNEGISGKAIPE